MLGKFCFWFSHPERYWLAFRYIFFFTKLLNSAILKILCSNFLYCKTQISAEYGTRSLGFLIGLGSTVSVYSLWN